MNAQNEDQRLTEQLRPWRGVEPRADFEAEVWRRVAAVPVSNMEWFETLRQWFGVQPAWAGAAAVLIAIFIGLSSARMAPRDRLTLNTPTLYGQTLTSTYLSMTSGGVR